MRSSSDWHQRFLQQAAWTHDLRQHLYRATNLSEAHRVLEVGCGTGAILSELPDYTPAEIVGVDIALPHLRHAQAAHAEAHCTHADARALPFADAAFDVTLCHFFLLWVTPPEAALAEMKRVTRCGGFVLALAEPDYGGRIDYPDSLAELGDAQTAALREQGADPWTGRRLPALLHAAGLRVLQSGILGASGIHAAGASERALEWRVLEDDLRARLPTEALARLRAEDAAAWQRGERVLFVPTFFALAQVD